MIEHLREAQRLVREHNVPPVVAADVIQEYVLLAAEGWEGDLWRVAVHRAWHTFEQRKYRFGPWPNQPNSSEPVEFEHTLHADLRTSYEREREYLISDRVRMAVEQLPTHHRRAVVEQYGLDGDRPLSRTRRAELHGTDEWREQTLVNRGRELIRRSIETGGPIPERDPDPEHPVELVAAVEQLPVVERQVAQARLEGLGPADTARRTGLSLSKVERTLRTIQKTIPLPPPRRTA